MNALKTQMKVLGSLLATIFYQLTFSQDNRPAYEGVRESLFLFLFNNRRLGLSKLRTREWASKVIQQCIYLAPLILVSEV